MGETEKKINIDRLREKINGIDNDILELLNKRALLAIEIGQLKSKEKRAVYAPEREKQIYDRLFSLNKGPISNKSIQNIYREIISASLSLEKALKVAYLGPVATFTHLACIRRFGLSAEFIQKKDISDVFSEVERDKADYGVVPIENTTEGVVSHTLDMFMMSELKICSEILMRVSLAIMSRSGNPDDILKIYSHPHAIAECRGWLNKHFNNLPLVDVSSTAMAAKMVSDDSSSAAIASGLAAEVYNLTVIEDNIQDHLNNYTRFLVIGKSIPKKSGIDKTSIMFSVHDSPGVLHKMLEPFARRGINLTKIESRPRKSKAWEYVFFLDIDGHASDDSVAEAMSELDKISVYMNVLGSYPKAEVDSSEEGLFNQGNPI